MDDQVTLLVHGTFANDDYEERKKRTPGSKSTHREWWELSPDRGASSDRVSGQETTADRLKAKLNPELAETVWAPGSDPRDGDLDYPQLVEWSGENSHKDRRKAGKQLGQSLGELASRRGHDQDNPLEVNLVGHSHGGNVILESLKHLPDNVKPRQLCLLGTPLVWRHIDPRILYLPTIALCVIGFLETWDESDLEPGLSPQEVAEQLAFYNSPGWYAFALFISLWATYLAIRFLRFALRRVLARPAYGPTPKKLRRLLDRPVQLFISDEDEADLMMHLGAAPYDAYLALLTRRNWVKESRKLLSKKGGVVRAIVLLPMRLIEFLIIRPLVYVIVLPTLEILLERFALGFPLRSVLVRNYEMVSWTRSDPYKGVIDKRPIDADKLQHDTIDLRVLVQEPQDADDDAESGNVDSDNRIERLRVTLNAAMKGLQKQVHLTHSTYYESQLIITDVAGQIELGSDEIDSETAVTREVVCV